MTCIAKLVWNDGVWYSKVITDDGKPVGLTLESESADTLIDRIKLALPEMLELNFAYKGNITVSFEIDRIEQLKTPVQDKNP